VAADAGPHGFVVGSSYLLVHGDRLPLLRTVHVPHVLSPLPRWDRSVRFSLASLTTAAFPVVESGEVELSPCSARSLKRLVQFSRKPLSCADAIAASKTN
jgi:hypothetical protein